MPTATKHVQARWTDDDDDCHESILAACSRLTSPTLEDIYSVSGISRVAPLLASLPPTPRCPYLEHPRQVVPSSTQRSRYCGRQSIIPRHPAAPATAFSGLLNTAPVSDRDPSEPSHPAETNRTQPPIRCRHQTQQNSRSGLALTIANPDVLVPRHQATAAACFNLERYMRRKSSGSNPTRLYAIVHNIPPAFEGPSPHRHHQFLPFSPAL